MSVTIPDSVERIERSAFYGCEKLKSVIIPASVTDIGNKAFGYYNDVDFGTELKVGDFTIYGYKGTEAERYADDNGFIFVEIDGQPTEPTQAPTQEPTLATEPTATPTTEPATVPSDPTKTTNREYFGDIDGDGEITIIDSAFLQRYATRLQTPYPIGEKMK
jgi:hypothetical protein